MNDIVHWRPVREELKHQPHPDWMFEFIAAASDKVESLPARSLVVVANSVSKIGVPLSPDQTERIAAALERCSTAFSPQDLANTLGCLVRIHHRPSVDWMQLLMQKMVHQMAHFKPQEMSLTMYAFSRLRFRPSTQVVQLMFRHSASHFGSCPPAHLALQAWSVAQMGLSPPGAWTEMLLTTLLLSIAHLRYALEDHEAAQLFPYLLQLLHEDALDARQLSNVAYALSRLDIRPDWDLRGALLFAVHEHREEFSDQGLSLTLWGLARILKEGEVPAEWLQAAAEQVLVLLPAYRPGFLPQANATNSRRTRPTHLPNDPYERHRPTGPKNHRSTGPTNTAHRPTVRTDGYPTAAVRTGRHRPDRTQHDRPPLQCRVSLQSTKNRIAAARRQAILSGPSQLRLHLSSQTLDKLQTRSPQMMQVVDQMRKSWQQAKEAKKQLTAAIQLEEKKAEEASAPKLFDSKLPASALSTSTSTLSPSSTLPVSAPALSTPQPSASQSGASPAQAGQQADKRHAVARGADTLEEKEVLEASASLAGASRAEAGRQAGEHQAGARGADSPSKPKPETNSKSRSKSKSDEPKPKSKSEELWKAIRNARSATRNFQKDKRRVKVLSSPMFDKSMLEFGRPEGEAALKRRSLRKLNLFR
eukprot:gene24192-9790_t